MNITCTGRANELRTLKKSASQPLISLSLRIGGKAAPLILLSYDDL
jgi:hypothetical protein